MVAAPALRPRNLRFGAARDASLSHVGAVGGFVTHCWRSNGPPDCHLLAKPRSSWNMCVASGAVASSDSSRWSSSTLSMLTGVEEPHHRCARLTIAIATLQSSEAELVIIDWNWRSRAFVTSVASWSAPRPSYSSKPARTFHGKPLATPSDTVAPLRLFDRSHGRLAESKVVDRLRNKHALHDSDAAVP